MLGLLSFPCSHTSYHDIDSCFHSRTMCNRIEAHLHHANRLENQCSLYLESLDLVLSLLDCLLDCALEIWLDCALVIWLLELALDLGLVDLHSMKV